MVGLCQERGWPLPAIAQPAYSWLQRDLEADYLPACRENGIGITPYRALEGGALSGKYQRGVAAPEGSRLQVQPGWLPVGVDFDRIEVFDAEASASARSSLAHALCWLLERPGVASIVIGVRRPQQLAQLAAAVSAAAPSTG